MRVWRAKLRGDCWPRFCLNVYDMYFIRCRRKSWPLTPSKPKLSIRLMWSASKSKRRTSRNDIAANIKRLEGEADHNRLWAFRLRITVAVLSAVTTVLVGISGKSIIVEPYVQILSIVTLVVSATISVIAAWDAFYSFRDIWILFSEGIQGLYALQRELKYVKVDGNSEPRLDDIFKRFQKIVDDTSRSWGRRRAALR